MKCISVQNIAAASAVLRMLLRIVVVKPDGEALDPHLWPGAVGSDRKSDIQAVEMSFRRRVTGLNLIDRVRRARSSAGCSESSRFFFASVELVRASCNDASWAPPLEGAADMTNWEGTLGQTQNSLEGLKIPSGLPRRSCKASLGRRRSVIPF